MVRHTIDGVTRLVEEPYTTQAPAPPLDWDHALLAAVTVAAATLLLTALVFGAASGGALLSEAVPAPIAYTMASAVDSGWIICIGIEYLDRWHDERAALPRWAGWCFLIVAMAEDALNGWLHGSWPTGLTAAAVSGVAKVVWTVVMRHHAVPLTPRTRAWLAAEKADLGAQAALLAWRRQAERTKAVLAAQRAVYGDVVDVQDDSPSPLVVTREARDAVQAAISHMPGASAAKVAAQLAHAGIEIDERVVQAVVNDTASDDDTQNVHALRPAANTQIAETVRTLLRSGMQDKAELRKAVLLAHPHASPETIRRTINKLTAASTR
ncbi:MULTISPECIES: hypothetical protein [Streptomycetaceae]|nr:MULTISPECIES: hypothetical protein [Streptomycetaceae]MYS57709.1 hypothetical protein [Streptomyces sp. SID5468]CCB73326.1 protein of unknown function [Streptantibioticus cattleyicolor NRRL 8057 = DSM 46488]